MSSDSLFTADFFLGLAISLAFTLIVYCAFPLIFSRIRSQPITKKAYRIACFIVNFVVMVLVKIAIGSTSWTFAPYILWTTVFSSSGCKKLEERGLLDDNGNSAGVMSSVETSKIAPEAKFVCKNCGTFSTGWYQICPTCGVKGQMVKTDTLSSASRSQDDEKRKIFYCERCGFVGSDYESNINSCPKCASRLKKTEISRRQWLSMSENEKKNLKDQWHDSKTESKSFHVEKNTAHGGVRFCRMCGSRLVPGAVFCSNCGAKLDIMPTNQKEREAEIFPEAKQLSEVQAPDHYESTGRHEGSYISSSNKVKPVQTEKDTPENFDIDSILKEFL